MTIGMVGDMIWSIMSKHWSPFIKTIKKKQGGLSSLFTEECVFKEYMTTYVLIMKGHVTYTLKTASGLKCSMFSASYTVSTNHSSSDSSKGQNVWLMDTYGGFFGNMQMILCSYRRGTRMLCFFQIYTSELMVYFKGYICWDNSL